MAVLDVLNKRVFPVRFFSGTRRNPGRLRVGVTATGWGFLGLMLCGFLMSVNFSNNLIFAMTFLLAGIALVGWWQTRSNLRGLELGDWRCDAVFARQQVVYRLPVNNPSTMKRYGLGLVAQESGDGKRSRSRKDHKYFFTTGNQSASLSEPEITLPARKQKEVVLMRTAPCRGMLAGSHAALRSRFPLGLFDADLYVGALPECLVYPTPGGDQPLPDNARGQQAHLQRESDNYTDMRRYAPGDPPSRIAWQALARFDELYLKEFDGAEGKPALWFTWDAVQATGVEDKLSQLCRWVLQSHDKGREYGLDIPGIKIEPAIGEAHLRQCLSTLALYGNPERRS